MKAKVVALTVLVGAALAVLPTAAYASCSIAAGQSAPLVRVMEEELTRLAPWKPGTDDRDVVWLKENVVKMVPEWLPNTKRVAARAEPEIDRVVDDCYQPGDYGVPGPARFEFIACAKEAAMTQLAPTRLSDWTAVCGEVRKSLQDPSTEAKVRAWTRDWVDAYIRYAETREAR